MSDLIVARNGRWVLASNGAPVLEEVTDGE